MEAVIRFVGCALVVIVTWFLLNVTLYHVVRDALRDAKQEGEI